MLNTYFDKQHHFFEIFNTETGEYIRTGTLDAKLSRINADEKALAAYILKNIQDDNLIQGEDPFMRDICGLLDIGVMGTCQHGQSGLCLQASNDCYQSGNKIAKPNMSVKDFKSIIEQVENKIFQVALGGRGDVNKHENFEDLLKICRDHNIIPNYTTSGLGLTDEEVLITKKYVGSAAISWYRHQHTFDAISQFIKAGIKTNIHFVLSKKSIDEAIDFIKNDKWPEKINAVIFLLYKPVGEGKPEYVLQADDPKLKVFFDLVNNFKGDYKLGFDSCSIPGIINFTNTINPVLVDTCEGARFSAYISADMNMLPCSFDQELTWAVNLKEYTIKEAWDSALFQNFRKQLRTSCPNCSDRTECYGGCPINRDIVLCNRKYKSYINH